MTLDPFTLEVIQEMLVSIVREMRTNLIRTAYSSVIYEGHDFSCALMDPIGKLLAQGEDNPSHLFPIRWSVQLMAQQFQGAIHPGDLFLHNDPYTGGTHLNDIALLYPVFVEGELLAVPVVRAHWGDVGGMTPGSLSGKAIDIHQEGLRFPLVKVYEAGRPNQSLLNLLFANVRVPGERQGDFRAMLGACRIAEERLLALLAKYEEAAWHEAMPRLLTRAEARMRQRIAQIPDGQYAFESYLDCCGTSLDPVRIQVALTVRDDTLYADYSGTTSQVPGPTNAGPAVAPTSTFAVVKAFLDPHGPMNDGAMAPVTVYTPPGSVVHATYPTPCGGFSEIRRGCESAVMGALAQVIPDQVTGDIKGTANHCYIGGAQSVTGEPFIFYEYPAGGTGAFLRADGNNVVRAFTEGDFNTFQPVEAVELRYPLRIERCELRPDSGGDGRTRGGLGLRRDVRLLAPAGLLSVLSDKNIIPPYGLLGGHSGAPNAFTVFRDGIERQPSNTPGKVAGFPLLRDDVVVMRSSGGGGYGDPLEREPELVREDVQADYISQEVARQLYGVVLRHGRVDHPATAALREHLQGERPWLRLGVLQGAEFRNGRRLAGLHSATAARLGVQSDAMLEVVNPRGASLRAWTCLVPTVPEGEIWLGNSGFQVLRVVPGDTLPVRWLPSILDAPSTPSRDY
jgi:N-methylhydantoinase B